MLRKTVLALAAVAAIGTAALAPTSASAHGFASARLNVVQTLFAKPDAQGRVDVPPRRE